MQTAYVITVTTSYLFLMVYLEMLRTESKEPFEDLGDLEYGDYDYTDRIWKGASENAWFWKSVRGINVIL